MIKPQDLNCLIYEVNQRYVRHRDRPDLGLLHDDGGKWRSCNRRVCRLFCFGSAPGTFSWVLNATITGGSGGFSRATGTFVFNAEGQTEITDNGVVHGNYTETFDGRIDY